MDERLLEGTPAPEERDREATLRPRVLGEFIGQVDVDPRHAHTIHT